MATVEWRRRLSFPRAFRVFATAWAFIVFGFSLSWFVHTVSGGGSVETAVDNTWLWIFWGVLYGWPLPALTVAWDAYRRRGGDN